MASAVLPILGDIAGGLLGGIFKPDAPDVVVPQSVEAPAAPAVLDTDAQAAEEAATTAVDQKRRAQRLAAASGELNKGGSLNTAPTKRTLLGD